jgi:hypothetical protein
MTYLSTHCLTRSDLIDKNTLEIKQDEDKTVYKDLQEIGEDLPDHSPRFILLSYPLTLVRIIWTAFFCYDEALAYVCIAIWSTVGAIRAIILSTGHLQRGVEDVVCRGKGVNEEYSRGWKGHRN